MRPSYTLTTRSRPCERTSRSAETAEPGCPSSCPSDWRGAPARPIRGPVASGQGHGSRRKLFLWIAAALVLMVAAAAATVGSASFSRRFCSSCHEMQPMISAWRASPHAEVECYSCHGSPYEWYRSPQALVDRAARLARFVRVHLSGRMAQAVGDGDFKGTIDDATCLHCHDPERTVTSRLGVLIQHQKHAERNKSCVSCHLYTAHPDANADRDMLMMQLCYECHGQPDQPKATAECRLCHPKGLPLRPQSHTEGDWKQRHGKLAKADTPLCMMCHREAFCQDCHGLAMPHPSGWARGKSSHGVVARRDHLVCEKCHVGRTNLCTMCHHQGYDQSKGPWVSQHFRMVQETGAVFCMRCHEGTFCVRCHTADRILTTPGPQ